MAEAESEFQVLQEIYGADFVALSEAECTIRLAEPWRKVVLLINVQDSYPATPAKVTLADDASEQLSPESAIALLDFLEATSAEHAGETALFTVVCEAQEYLSSQEQASGATASAPPTQSASQASTVSSKSHADAPVVANATSDGAASSNVKAESTASQLTSTASPSEPVPLQSGTPAVCRFFKKGQCKFGDSCLNLHPGAVGKKSRAASAATTTTTAAAATPASNSSEMTATEPSAPGKGSSASAEGGKKTPMRQVVDVIHRIQVNEWCCTFKATPNSYASMKKCEKCVVTYACLCASVAQKVATGIEAWLVFECALCIGLCDQKCCVYTRLYGILVVSHVCSC
eukprot:scpid83415/ scgid0808/ 